MKKPWEGKNYCLISNFIKNRYKKYPNADGAKEANDLLLSIEASLRHDYYAEQKEEDPCKSKP